MSNEPQKNIPIAKTGLFALYWKYAASQPLFWKKNGSGASKREKALFKDEIMENFIRTIDGPTIEIAKNAIDPKMQTALAVRHKFFNKQLSSFAKTSANSEAQVVILGSGYDTRAIRKKKFRHVKYFEIDHPGVLKDKANLCKTQNIDSNAVYIEADYLKDDLIEKLKTNSIDFNLPTLFIWEGNTMYVEKTKVKETLLKIKNAFNTVSVSFDYFSEKIVHKMTNIPEADEMINKAVERKTPMITGYNSVELDNMAKEIGLNVIKKHVCAELSKEYGVDDNPFPTQEHYSFCTLKN